MKRKGDLYEQIYQMNNLVLADLKARKGKMKQPAVKIHLLNESVNLLELQKMLKEKSYRTSAYTQFTIYEPKERIVSRLPYFPDRIAHHAIMNVLKPYFVSCFTADTYSCIEGKGIHGAANAVKRSLQDVRGTTYCLKLDIRKFYPSINHDTLKSLLKRKFKDPHLLWILGEIIDSAPGIPIGNYLSQYFANFYLTYFDHWVKETKREKYYFRYADDIVVLGNSKPHLHSLLNDIRIYLDTKLKLQVKDNYQIFPVASRGIDFVGYVFRHHGNVRLRKSIKQNFARKVARGIKPASVASYAGWTKHCKSRHLVKKLLHEVV
jgi:retron-type reverse transcriptase